MDLIFDYNHNQFFFQIKIGLKKLLTNYVRTPMIIYLDFDGTIVEQRYPLIGKYNEGSLTVIKKLQDAGHDIIINTFRANCSKSSLKQALNFLNNKEMKSEDILEKIENININEIHQFNKIKIHPHWWDWEHFFDNNFIFIDDHSQGIPLKENSSKDGWIVDWKELNKQFIDNGIYECNLSVNSY